MQHDIHFTDDVGPLFQTVREIMLADREQAGREVLAGAVPFLEEVDYDNWNGGTYSYTLKLRVSLPAYAAAKKFLEAIEKKFLAETKMLLRTETNHFVTKVVIVSAPPEGPLPAIGSGYRFNESSSLWEPGAVRESPISPYPESRIWKDGYFRLFLSHTHHISRECHEIRRELQRYHVDAFVAHEDLRPAEDWQLQIEEALRTMDSLLAFVTDEFALSDWTDQEVGWSLGRDVPVVPVKIDRNPSGFIGRLQAETLQLNDPEGLCNSVFEILSGDERLGLRVAAALVHKMERSAGYTESYSAVKILERRVRFLDDKLLDRLISACATNTQVGGTFTVQKRILEFVELVRGKSPS